MNIDGALEKAMEQAVVSSEAKTEEKVTTPSDKPQLNEGATKQTEDKAGETESSKEPVKDKSLEVWDGNPNSLPDFMQEHGKKVQRFITQRTTEAAEQKKVLEKKVQEYESTLNSEELKNFRTWQNQQKVSPPATVDKAIDDGTITQQEWEDALLDLTGAKASSLIKRSIQMEVNKAREEYSKEIQKEKDKETSVRSWENRIAEFADVHPEIVDFHKMGLMKPMLKEVLASGGTLEEAFEKVKAMVDGIRGVERNKLNGSIEEKKGLTSVDKTPKVKADVVYVDNADEALDRIIGDAMDKKPAAKVKIRPNKK